MTSPTAEVMPTKSTTTSAPTEIASPALSILPQTPASLHFSTCAVVPTEPSAPMTSPTAERASETTLAWNKLPETTFTNSEPNTSTSSTLTNLEIWTFPNSNTPWLVSLPPTPSPSSTDSIPTRTVPLLVMKSTLTTPKLSEWPTHGDTKSLTDNGLPSRPPTDNTWLTAD